MTYIVLGCLDTGDTFSYGTRVRSFKTFTDAECWCIDNKFEGYICEVKYKSDINATINVLPVEEKEEKETDNACN